VFCEGWRAEKIDHPNELREGWGKQEFAEKTVSEKGGTSGFQQILRARLS